MQTQRSVCLSYLYVQTLYVTEPYTLMTAQVQEFRSLGGCTDGRKKEGWTGTPGHQDSLICDAVKAALATCTLGPFGVPQGFHPVLSEVKILGAK